MLPNYYKWEFIIWNKIKHFRPINLTFFFFFIIARVKIKYFKLLPFKNDTTLITFMFINKMLYQKLHHWFKLVAGIVIMIILKNFYAPLHVSAAKKYLITCLCKESAFPLLLVLHFFSLFLLLTICVFIIDTKLWR